MPRAAGFKATEETKARMRASMLEYLASNPEACERRRQQGAAVLRSLLERTRRQQPIIDCDDHIKVEVRPSMFVLLDKCDRHFAETSTIILRGRYFAIKIGREYVLLHRAVISAPVGMFVDHINMEPRDNRRANLRLATKSQNMRNREKTKRNRAGYKGVSLNKETLKWEAKICLNQVQKRLGAFASAEDAARAYDSSALDLHGEFARLNFPTKEAT